MLQNMPGSYPREGPTDEMKKTTKKKKVKLAANFAALGGQQ
jgi:hypothetical protein